MIGGWNQAERAYWSRLGYAPEEYDRLCKEESYARATGYLEMARAKDRRITSAWIVLTNAGLRAIGRGGD